MSLSFAPAGSGPNAGGIGWFNFGTATFNPGSPAVNVTGTLNDGTVVSFDVDVTNDAGTSAGFQALQPPSWPGTFFANPAFPGGYNGVVGNIDLISNFSGTGINTLHMRNITLTDTDGNPVTNYTAIVADAESTDLSEIMTWASNGGGWTQFALLGNTIPPTITGLGTGTVTMTGAQAGVIHENYVLTTNSPSQLDLSVQSTAASARLGFAVAFAVTKVEIQKNVQGRLDPADQFNLDITGNFPGTATTTGNANGLQTQSAIAFGYPDTAYTVNESMAPGSVNPLSAYTTTVTAVNLSPGQTIPPAGTLPQTLTPTLGDIIIYTVTNALIPPTVTKSVNPAFADLGDVITYTVTVNNPNAGILSGVDLQDAIPAGTTFADGSVTATNATVVGTNPSLGLTLNDIPAGTAATVTWQVTVGNAVPSPNPIPNTATITDPAGNVLASNQVTTTINYVALTTTKAVDVAYAEFGQVLTYTITLNNSGNTPANNVVITDSVPNGTTFVPGSVTGATGTPPTLNVASIPAGGNAVVTFQVQVGDTVPVPNPIVNTADTAFTYTIDPANPNGASGNAPSSPVTTQVNDANITTTKSVDKTSSDVGQVLTYTLVLNNTGNVAANNVVITDPVPNGTTFINGSLFGATGTPPTLNVPSIPAGGSVTVSYQVLIGNAIPTPNPIPNTASVAFTFTLDPANPDGQVGSSTSNTVNTQVSSAIVETIKTADKAFANVGDTITYTITVTNSGNVSANNVVLTDALPAGTSFVAGSLVGATGTPPTLTLNASVPAGGSGVVSYQVLVGAAVPNPNPVKNSASTAFTYTVDSAQPNGASGTSYSNIVPTQVNTAKLVMQKSVDKMIAYQGDTITYQIAIKNTGNVPANNVVITDPIPIGTVLVPGSMVVSVPYTALPGGAIQLTNPVLPGETVTISFKVLVTAIPNPNPIVNVANAAYTFTIDPANPDGTSATAQTNAATTTVFRNNFGQQISDLIESVALEQAALAAIANAEGAKIQAAAAMGSITQEELLCINKSVSDMMDSLTMLEAVLKQKLGVVNCQIDSGAC